MKKLLFILLLIFSCSPETESEELIEDCRCTKTTYEIVQETIIGTNGLPQIIFYENVLFTEEVNKRVMLQKVVSIALIIVGIYLIM